MPRSNPTQTLHPQTSHSPRPLPSFVSATPLLSVSVTFHAFSSAVHLPFGPSVVSDVLTMREFKQIAAAKLQGASHEQIAKSNEEARAIFAGLDANGEARIDAKEHFAYASGTFAGLTAIYLLRSWSNAARTRSLEAPRPSIMPRIGSTTSRQRSSRNSSSVRWAQSSSCENDAIRSVEVIAAVHK